MKRKIKFLLVVLISLVLIPVVKAEIVIKEKANRTYVFEPVSYVCPEADGNYVISEFYNDWVVFYNIDISDAPHYKKYLTGGECSVMTLSEERDYEIFQRENSKTVSYEWNDQNEIYKVETFNYEDLYFITGDTEIETGKSYYIHESEGNFNLVDFPVVEDISTYYEKNYFISYNSLTIDAGLTYYKLDSTDDFIASVVPDPNQDDILDYYILFDESEHILKTYILTADYENFEDENLEKQRLYNIVEVEGEKYLVFDYYDSEAVEHYFALYTTSGEVLKDKDGTETLKLRSVKQIFENDIMIVEYLVDEAKLIASDLNTINTFDGYDFIIMQAKDNYAYIVIHNMTLPSKYYKITMYELSEGSNQKYDNGDLTFKFNGDLNELNNVKLNGNDLDSDNYTATSGSTIITLKNDFLKTLESGSHTLTVEYTNGGYASAAFTVDAANPQTFDGVMTYVALGIISLIGFVGTLYFIQKRCSIKI